MARIEFKDSSGKEKTLKITSDSGEIFIGRNFNCQVITTDPSVSRNHGKIILEKSRYIYQDLGSVNGTKLNDNPIKRAILSNGDILKCGEFVLKFFDEVEETPESIIPKKSNEGRGIESLRDERAPRVLKESQQQSPRMLKETEHALNVKPNKDTEYSSPLSVESHEKQKIEREIRESRSVIEEQESKPANIVDIQERPSYRRPERVPSSVEPRESQQLKQLISENEALKQELARIRASMAKGEGEAINLSQMIERLKYEKQNLENKLESFKETLEEKDKKLNELEIRNTRMSVEMDTITEKYLQIKDQVSHQKKLLDDTRSEIEDKDDKIIEYESKIKELQSLFYSQKSKENESVEKISDLKVRLTHKDREIEEIKRQLDLMEYEMKEVREQNESLQASFNREGGIQSDLERKVNQLKEILTEKENIISQLRIDLEEKDKEILQVKMGVGFTSLEEEKRKILMDYYQVRRQLDELKDKMRDRDYEQTNYRAKIEQLEKEIVQTKEQAADISYHPEYKKKVREIEKLLGDQKNLEENFAEIQKRLKEFSPELKRELEAKIETLEKKNESLLSKLSSVTREIKAIDQVSIERAAINEKLITSSKNSEEILSQMKSDLLMLKSITKDITTYLSVIKEIENLQLPVDLRKKLEDIDPDEMLSSLSDLITVFLVNTDNLEVEISTIQNHIVDNLEVEISTIQNQIED